MNIFLCRKDFFYLVTFVTIQFFPAFWSQAAKAPASKQQLESIATHIVVGNVQAVYSYKEREGIPLVSGYEYDHKVAEVKIEKVEKGEISESLVYVRYWSRTWKGIGAATTRRTVLQKPAEKGSDLPVLSGKKFLRRLVGER
jgi:hypothetical protein